MKNQNPFNQSYQRRQKVIKRIIFWSLVFGALIALLFSPTMIDGKAQPADICQTFGNCLKGTESVEPGQEGIARLIINVATTLVYIGTAISVVMIVWAGFNMITSNGDDEKYKNGQKTLSYAVIGLILSIVSFTIVNLIGVFLPGLDLSNT